MFHMLDKWPQDNVGLRIHNCHHELGIGYATNVTDFKDQVGVERSSHQFKFAPGFQECIKLVVGQVGCAGICVTLAVGNKNLPGSCDLDRYGSSARSLWLLRQSRVR